MDTWAEIKRLEEVVAGKTEEASKLRVALAGKVEEASQLRAALEARERDTGQFKIPPEVQDALAKQLKAHTEAMEESARQHAVLKAECRAHETLARIAEQERDAAARDAQRARDWADHWQRSYQWIDGERTKKSVRVKDEAKERRQHAQRWALGIGAGLVALATAIATISRYVN